MPAIFHRQTSVSCFFCQSGVSPLPKNPTSFRCPHCGCWNRYDAKGEIHSQEPAMHDESLNSKSFAKHASPSKDHLPSVYGKAPFCHTCTTNQMLLVNLLANYLPPPESSEYARRVEMLPEYKESLHLRYPPVCASCLPLVEEEIRNKDHMARTKALGGWLKQSRGKGKQQQASEISTERQLTGRTFLWWRFRGCLWVGTLALALLGNSVGAFDLRLPYQPTNLIPYLPAFALISIFWTAWDPTYSSLRRAQLQGRDIRLRGKDRYVVSQMIAWFSRNLTALLLCTSRYFRHLDYLHLLQQHPRSIQSRIYFSVSLALEFIVLLASITSLRIHHPPSVRLIDTKTHTLTSSRHTSPTPPNPTPTTPLHSDFLETLSLSSKPVIGAPANPIFGQPSLLSTLSHPDTGKNDHIDDDADAMDWTPTNPSPANTKRALKSSAGGNDGFWLRPQRFFAPEQPTGLESLLARAGLADDVDMSPDRTNAPRLWNWWWVYALSLVPIIVGVVVYRVWGSRNRFNAERPICI